MSTKYKAQYKMSGFLTIQEEITQFLNGNGRYVVLGEPTASVFIVNDDPVVISIGTELRRCIKGRILTINRHRLANRLAIKRGYNAY